MLGETLVVLRIRPQPENDFGPLGERLGGQIFVGVFGKVFGDECVDSLPVLAGVDFHTFMLTFEELNCG